MPVCRQCKNSFEYHQSDLLFYKKIDVPSPLDCPDCRHRQRSVWRNSCKLYQRRCDLCKKNIVSVFSADKPYLVYCHDCWFSDKWDGTSYSRDFDFSRPFFSQFEELVLAAPQLAINNVNSVNSEYTHHASRNKNCYLQFEGSTECEDCYYGWASFRSKDCIDVVFCYDSELCYECCDIENCYDCSFTDYSRGCHDCYFCYDCVGCTNCFGCVNLRNVKNYLWNKPASPEEISRIKEGLAAFSAAADIRKKFIDIKALAVVAPAHSFKITNSTGDYIRYCKNSHDIYDLYNVEDCGYVINGESIKDAYDCSGYGGTPSELAYQCISTGRGSYGTFFDSLTWESRNVWYSHCIFTCQEIFGCASLHRKKYCLFNKQYNEDEYTELKDKIVKHMKQTGEWGEFFPYQLSLFGYNESRSQLDLPLTKEQALKFGAKWKEEDSGAFGRETASWDRVPESIKEIREDISSEILTCSQCSRNYKILKPEFNFYQRQSIALPRSCPDCRLERRLNSRNPKRLWRRQCMHEGCQNEFETTYAPDRPEKVYCQECYQKEIY
ncbi:MAG: hypothetical protein WC480_02940 [Patescibacteria group bacterium]